MATSQSKKRSLNGHEAEPTSIKRAKLLDDSESESEGGGVAIGEDFKINTEYAERFEHNEKRKERHRRKCLYMRSTVFLY